MLLLMSVLITQFAATTAFAVWVIRKIHRLRISVNLAHSDLSDIRCRQGDFAVDRLMRR